MNNDSAGPADPRVHRPRLQRCITLLITAIVFGVLAVLAAPAVSSFVGKGRIAGQLCSGRQIYLALRNYASENAGAFPSVIRDEAGERLATTSSEAFELLIPRYFDDKRPFFNKSSAWCFRRVGGASFENHIYPGENDWVYVRGLTGDSPSRYPLLANAFTPGTLTYGSDPKRPGGVWKGQSAVVIWAGGSGEIVETQRRNDTEGYSIRRSDRAERNAFETDGEWLNGETIRVLYPQLPDAKAIPPEAVLSADAGC
jgi:type II secretory pathway pseudopilin PulG